MMCALDVAGMLLLYHATVCFHCMLLLYHPTVCSYVLYADTLCAYGMQGANRSPASQCMLLVYAPSVCSYFCLLPLYAPSICSYCACFYSRRAVSYVRVIAVIVWKY
eukprot:680332-Rhodomonas_salina.1